MTTPTTIVLLSGGLDSTALVAHMLAAGERVHALSVHYGQRHVRELEAATAVADYYDIRHDVVDLGGVGALLAGNALTDDAVDVPDGHYAEDSMRATVVPNRNAIMLSVAVGVASSRGAQKVATAVHAGDHFVYPDCRPEFIRAISFASQLGTATFGDVRVIAPFVTMSKTRIAGHGIALGAPLILSWSCYKGGDVHCGTCGTCGERREAFREAGLVDPTIYADDGQVAA
jgi:7-cyano-7-deazaguanine synthase